MICSKCESDILQGDGITCTVCSSESHYGCQGMLEINFRKMGKRIETWKCLDCKVKKNKNDLNEVNQGVDETNTTQMRELFEEYTGKITTKIDEIMNMHVEMNARMVTLENKQKQLEKENEILKNNLEEMKIQNESRLDDLENRSRNCNLEIKNVPETKEEDVVKIIHEIGKAIGIQNFTEGDVQVAHRVDFRNKERGHRTIIAHMSSRYMRNKWLNHYRNFLKSGNNGQRTQLKAKAINKNLADDVPIYINEHLTVQKKILLKKCKETAAQNGIKHVWVKDAYILVRKMDKGPVMKINTQQELEKYVQQMQANASANGRQTIFT